MKAWLRHQFSTVVYQISNLRDGAYSRGFRDGQDSVLEKSGVLTDRSGFPYLWVRDTRPWEGHRESDGTRAQALAEVLPVFEKVVELLKSDRPVDFITLNDYIVEIKKELSDDK